MILTCLTFYLSLVAGYLVQMYKLLSSYFSFIDFYCMKNVGYQFLYLTKMHRMYHYLDSRVETRDFEA